MKKRKFTDSEYVEAFRTENGRIIKAFMDETFPIVLKYVKRNGGSIMDAEDIAQDGYKVLSKKSLDNNFDYYNNLLSYYLGVCKNLWWKSVEDEKKAHLYVIDQPTTMDMGSSHDELQYERMRRFLLECIKLMDKKCYKLISLRLSGKSYDFIAKRLNIGNSKRARDQKYRCTQKLYNLVFTHKDYKDLTNE